MGRTTCTLAALLLIAGISPSLPTDLTAEPNWAGKLDSALQHAAGAGRSRVILRTSSAAALTLTERLAQDLGGRIVRRLPMGRSVALDLPNNALPAIAASPLVGGIL